VCPRLTFCGLVVVGLVASSVGGGPSGRKSGPDGISSSDFISSLDLSQVPAPLRDAAQRGSRALVEGRFSAAVESLSGLALDLPENAAVQTVLAEALLARSSTANGSPRDLAVGLDAVEHAVALAPRSDVALFIRAEILTRLHLPAAATSAWTRYLAVDPDSPRAGHAQAAIETLSAPSAFDLWERGDRARFEAAASAGDLRALLDLVKRYPLFARLQAEEILLPQWGRSGAAKEFEELQRVAAAFETVLHDSMLADTVAAIEKATPEERAPIARGLVSFGEGMERYRQRKKGDANSILRDAVEWLEIAHSPFSEWPRYYLTVSLQYRAPDAADRELVELDKETDSRRYPSLAGRIQWLRGTCAVVQERPETSLGHYRHALDLLVATEGTQGSGFLHLLIAEAFAKLGDREEEWRQYSEALNVLTDLGEPRARHPMLFQIAESLLADDLPWAASGVARELGRASRNWGISAARAEAALQEGRILERLGDSEGSIGSFRRAQAFVSDVDRPDLRERIDAVIEMAIGRSLAKSQPVAAIARLDSALSRQRRIEYVYQEASLLVSRASAKRSLGRFVEAAEDLRNAIEIYEGKRRATGDLRLRQSSFEEAQAAFDAMISLQAEDLGNPAAAFAFAERSRARLVLDQLARHRKVGERQPQGTLNANTAEATWPRDVTLIEYVALSDRLYVWTLASGRLRMEVVPVSALILERDIRTLASAVGRTELDAESLAAAKRLYERLIRPIQKDLTAGTDLAIVPDRYLARLPFDALLDSATGRFLIDDHASALQPSASLFLAARCRGRADSAHAGSLLVIGDPAFDSGAYPSLQPLPGARAEAREIAALSPGSTLLVGKAATRDSFLRSAFGAAVIHIAAHAILDPRDPTRSLLILSPGLNGSPGSISASEIAGLDLSRTRLVVLSVCRGAVAGDLGRENISGLAAAFLTAGASTVIASLGDISDRHNRKNILNLYTLILAGSSPSQAFRVTAIHAKVADETGGLRLAVYGAV